MQLQEVKGHKQAIINLDSSLKRGCTLSYPIV